jgi:UPF0755 protein
MLIPERIAAVARRNPRTAILLLIFLAAAGVFLHYSLAPVNPRLATELVVIPKGAGFLQITDLLHEAGLTGYRPLFWTLALVKGAARQIRAGEYELSGSMSPYRIIDKLARGDIKYYQVTLPEDLTVSEVADRLATSRLIDRQEFMDLAEDRAFLASLDIAGGSAEGYLFPDTYRLDRSMTTRDIMERLIRQFWTEITPDMRQRAAEMDLTISEWVTLASMIGKETGKGEEKPLVSAVFHNRLRLGMKLQSDPTAVYRLDRKGDAVRTVLRSHLAADTPHNTYRIKGLPPGPIANPGLDSLRAALFPAPVDFLYFVARNDGTHHFSTTFEMHNQAISKYQNSRQKK